MTDLRFLVLVLCASALTIAPARALAADTGSSDDWQLNAGVYLWGAGIQVDAASGSEVDIGFDNLINNLNMALIEKKLAPNDADGRRLKTARNKGLTGMSRPPAG